MNRNPSLPVRYQCRPEGPRKRLGTQANRGQSGVYTILRRSIAYVELLSLRQGRQRTANALSVEFRLKRSANSITKDRGGRTLDRNATGSILIVDDDDRFRAFLSELLESVGYRTEQVATGTEVLRAAAIERPAVVILDVQLPGLNGYEVCRQLRDRYRDSLSILFISGERTEALDRAGGLLLGADDYITKPVDPTELIARIRRVAGRPGDASTADAKLASLTGRE